MHNNIMYDDYVANSVIPPVVVTILCQVIATVVEVSTVTFYSFRMRYNFPNIQMLIVFHLNVDDSHPQTVR